MWQVWFCISETVNVVNSNHQVAYLGSCSHQALDGNQDTISNMQHNTIMNEWMVPLDIMFRMYQASNFPFYFHSLYYCHTTNHESNIRNFWLWLRSFLCFQLTASSEQISHFKWGAYEDLLTLYGTKNTCRVINCVKIEVKFRKFRLSQSSDFTDNDVDELWYFTHLWADHSI